MNEGPASKPLRREWVVDKHLVHFDPPDLLRMQLIGPCSLREAVRFVEIQQELVKEVGPFFVMYDLQLATDMEPDARQYIGERIQDDWVLGHIYFNTRLLHRAIAMGLAVAAELLQPEDSSRRAKTHFTSSRDKAEELLAQLRAQRGREPE